MTDQVREIFEGWKNFLTQKELSADQLRVAELRLNSCSNCKHARELWIKKVIGFFVDVFGKRRKKRERAFIGFQCTICSCPLDIKCLSPSTQCPADPRRWDRVLFSEDGKLISPEAIYISEPN